MLGAIGGGVRRTLLDLFGVKMGMHCGCATREDSSDCEGILGYVERGVVVA